MLIVITALLAIIAIQLAALSRELQNEADRVRSFLRVFQEALKAIAEGVESVRVEVERLVVVSFRSRSGIVAARLVF